MISLCKSSIARYSHEAHYCSGNYRISRRFEGMISVEIVLCPSPRRFNQLSKEMPRYSEDPIMRFWKFKPIRNNFLGHTAEEKLYGNLRR
jgi:hypothetical protein